MVMLLATLHGKASRRPSGPRTRLELGTGERDHDGSDQDHESFDCTFGP